MRNALGSRWLGASFWATALLGLAGFVRADTVPAVAPLRVPQDPPAEPLKLSGSNPEVEAATASFRQGKVDEARRQLAAAVAANPTLPPVDALLAVLYLTSNQAPQGRLLLEKAAAEGPEHPDIYLLFGRIALAERRLTDAALAFEKAAAIAPPPGLTDEQKANLAAGTNDGLALVAEARGRWAEARERIQAVLAIRPKNGPLRQRLGRALFHLGENDQAFEALKQATLDEPSLPPAGVVMGQLFAQKGDQGKAEEWMGFAVKAEPKAEKPRLGRAAWLIDQGRSEEAKADLDAAAEFGPTSNDLRRLRGMLDYSLGDYAGAEAEFQSLVQASPANLEAANLLTLALAAQDDQAKLRRALEQATVNARQYPNQAVVLATLGWAQFRSGQAEQAEQTFRAAATKGQFSTDAVFQFAQVLDARGKVEDARKLVETALNAPGGFLHRAKARAWLADHPAAEPGPSR